ncbi:MAG: DUF4399 domain-containing protein [Roseinatronobacter sp.]
MLRLTTFAFALTLAGQGFAQSHSHGNHGDGAARTPAPENAMAYIISPADGATVSNPVTILFGARGIGIAPANVEWPNTGHHHLLINVDTAEIDLDLGLPADDQHRHFGGGQTQVTLELPAGTHTLRLLMGDHNHVPHMPPILSKPVTITVQ